jgi:predicted CXXCH cytochrome family protein
MVGSLSLVLALLPLFGAPRPPPKEGFCIACHAKEADPRLNSPTSSVAASVHSVLETPCVACHGGDAREPTMRAHDKERGFRGKPLAADVPRVCGGCHSDAAFMRRWSAKLPVDQLALYRVSGHGLALAEGQTDVATCVSCHGFHSVKRVSDPASPVAKRNIAGTCARCHADPDHRASKLGPRHGGQVGGQVDRWKNSAHAAALELKDQLGAPTCNGCHGAHGAMPPGVSELHRVCGQCHPVQSEAFLKSPHAEPFQRLGFSECAECHGTHEVQPTSEAMLDPGVDGVCRRCHDETTEGYAAAKAILERLHRARAIAERARGAAERARRAGLLVPEADLAENELQSGLLEIAVAVHGMTPGSLDAPLGAIEKTAQRMESATAAAEESLRFERKGGIGFLGLVGLLIALLSWKVRRLDRA